MPRSPPNLTDGLFQLSFAVQALLTDAAEAYDLTLTQVRLMGILRDREPGMLELAGYLGLEKSSLSGLVERAEKRGLVERVPSPTDRRAATVRVTARGTKLAREVEASITSQVGALVSPLTDTEQKRLAALIWRVLPKAPDET